MIFGAADALAQERIYRISAVAVNSRQRAFTFMRFHDTTPGARHAAKADANACLFSAAA